LTAIARICSAASPNIQKESVKNPLSRICSLALMGSLGAHAQISNPVPAEVAAFLASPTHCAVLIGGADRAGDGADRMYGESLSKAMTALGGTSSSASEGIRSLCTKQLGETVDLPKVWP
jgi:hypothetical protein